MCQAIDCQFMRRSNPILKKNQSITFHVVQALLPPFSNASETQQFSLPHNSPCLKILHLLPYGFPRQMCEVHKLRGPNLGLDESWCVEGLKQQELQPGGAVDVFLPEDTGFTGFVLQSLSPSKPGRIALALAFLWAASSVQCLTHDHTICHQRPFLFGLLSFYCVCVCIHAQQQAAPQSKCEPKVI